MALSVIHIEGADWCAGDPAKLSTRYLSGSTFNSTNFAINAAGRFGGSTHAIGIRAASAGPELRGLNWQTTTSCRILWAGWVKLTKTGAYSGANELGLLTLLPQSGNTGVHAQISFDPNTDAIKLWRGTTSGTLLKSATFNLDDGAWHWVEWAIFSDLIEGESKLRVDGAVVTGLTVAASALLNTRGTSDGGVGRFYITSNRVSGSIYVDVDIDDVVVFDWEADWNGRAGAYGEVSLNAIGGTSTFTNGYAGLRKITLPAGASIDRLKFRANAAAATAKYRPVVFADNGNTPAGGARLAQGNEITGVTIGTNTAPLSSTYTAPGSPTVVWVGLYLIVADIVMRSPTANETMHYFANGGSDAPAATCPATSNSSWGWNMWPENAALADAYTIPTSAQIRVSELHPTTDSSVQFTPATGASNAAMVNEQSFLQTSSYVESLTLNHLDLYNLDDLDTVAGYVPADVTAVKTSVHGILASGTSVSMAAALKSGATTFLGATTSVGGSDFSHQQRIDSVDPIDSAAWTKTKVNALTAGQKIMATAGSGLGRAVQMFLEVAHATAPGAPSAISDLAGAATSKTVVQLTFTAAVGATSHEERHSLAGANSWSAYVAFTSGSNVTGLSAGTSYDFQVRGVNTGGNGPASNTDTELTFPGDPTAVSVTANGKTTAVFAFTGGTGAASHEYQVTAHGAGYGGFPDSGTAITSGANATGLSAGTSYDFRMRSINASGNGDWVTAGTSVLTFPGDISAPSVTPTSKTAVTISFTGGAGAASHESRHTITGAGSYSSPAAIVSGGSRSGLTAGTSYDFQVRSVNASGNGDWITAGTFILTFPGDVSNLVALVQTTTAVRLTFTAGGGAASHQERHSPAGAGTWSSAATITSGSNVTGLTPGSSYDFEVRSVNASGNGDWIGPDTESTIAGTISDLAAAPVDTVSVALTFTPSVGAETHQERHSLAGQAAWSAPAAIASGGGTVAGLTPAAAYDFQVRGVDASSGAGAYSNTATTSTTTPVAGGGKKLSLGFGEGIVLGRANRKGI